MMVSLKMEKETAMENASLPTVIAISDNGGTINRRDLEN